LVSIVCRVSIATAFQVEEGSLGKKIGSRPLSKERDPDEGYD